MGDLFLLRERQMARIEPPRLQRRPFGLSHAAIAVSPSMA